MGILDYRIRRKELEAEQREWDEVLRIAKKEEKFYALPDDRPLTDEQKRQIDVFWKKYDFMGKIDYTAFQTFYNRCGIFDPRYVPHYFIKHFMRPVTAPVKYSTAFQNKAYLPKLLTGAKQPETIVRRVEGIYYNEKFQRIDEKQAIEICLKVLEGGREIVVKPSGLAGGQGVEFLSSAGADELRKIFRKKGLLFVVQKAIHQHPKMAKLNESTVNTIRLTTFMYKGKFMPVAALIKIGAPSVRVDNYKHGGCLLGVNMDGTVLPWALNIDRQHITELPSGVKLGEGGFDKVPCFDNVLATAERAHYDIPKIKLISWDIAIDDENEAEIIEANFGGDLRMHQVLTGPVFGDMTEKILDYYVLRKFKRKGITPEFDYDEYHDHVVITKLANVKAKISVPAEIQGKPVTEIGPYAFAYQKKLLEVYLPDTIERLGEHAFFACTALRTLQLNLNNIKKVDKSVVNRCYKLDKEFKDRLRAKE